MQRFQTPGGGMRFGGFGITPAVKGLLIANVAMFLLQSITSMGRPHGIGIIENWGVFHTGAAVFHFQVWRFFTYMFLHGDFTHIMFNMFGLWMFGSQIEALWGRKNFLTFYFICGLGGAVFYALFDIIGFGTGGAMLGASGAVYGLLLAYGMTFPNNILLVGFIIPMKAKYAVLIFGLLALFASASGSGGQVAHMAHLGGMVAGFIFMMTTIPNIRARVLGSVQDYGGIWRRFTTKRRMRVVPPRPKPGNGSSNRGSTPPPSGNQKQIDTILDKISRDGLQSLSDEEQEILRKAGRR